MEVCHVVEMGSFCLGDEQLQWQVEADMFLVKQISSFTFCAWSDESKCPVKKIKIKISSRII